MTYHEYFYFNLTFHHLGKEANGSCFFLHFFASIERRIISGHQKSLQTFQLDTIFKTTFHLLNSVCYPKLLSRNQCLVSYQTIYIYVVMPVSFSSCSVARLIHLSYFEHSPHEALCWFKHFKHGLPFNCSDTHLSQNPSQLT